MSPRKSLRIESVAKRRELEIAAAVAREKVMQYHVASALRLIALAADRVSPIRMLEIFLRLHHITGPEAEVLAYRVLAAIGETAPPSTARLYVQGEDESPQDSGSLFRVLRDRLRGRVHHDLRRWVELATGAAQAGLVEIHVKHAHKFAHELTETHTVAQAAQVYADMVDMPQSLRSAFGIHLLEKLATEELPRMTTPTPQERPQPQIQVPRLSRRHAV